MNKRNKDNDFGNLPQSAQDFIKLVIKKMRYRKKVRLDVQAELAAHFEDELRDCENLQQREQRAKELIEQFGDAKLLGILLRRAKRRCRPLWRIIVARTFQTIGVLILCFIFYSIWFFTGKPAVKIDYLAQLNRMVRPVADDSLNAAQLFDEAVAICPNTPDRKVGFWRTSYFDANQIEKETISDLVNQYTASLEFIAQGVEKHHHWFEYKTGEKPGDDGSLLGILMPNLADFRDIARALCFRAQIQAAKEQYSEAFDDLITCYKFGRLIGQGEKNIIEQLVGIAVQVIAISNTRSILTEYELDSQQLATLQDDFSKAQAGQEFRMRLLNEKLMVFDEIQRCFTDGFGGGHLYPKRILTLGEMNGSDLEIAKIVLVALLVPKNWDDAARFMFFHPNKAETKQQADDFYNFIEETSKMSPAELREKEIDLGKKEESMSEGNIFLRILTPALGKVHQLSYRLKADVKSLPVIIAALRFKADKGQHPENLAELLKEGYIDEIPIDPFSNKPLVYMRTDEGFILYSIGYDFEDNGGILGTNSKGKKRLWADEGDAVFWPVQK